jgi:trans-aconitate methyltransferase
VAIELHRRGHPVVGVDSDPAMLAAARAKAPDLDWHQADLAQPLALGRRFDTVLLAGNVLIFVAPGTEGAVIANLAGLLVPDRLDVPTHNALAASAGLELEDRWSTWDRAPLGGGSSYTVSVHRRPG